MTTSSTRPSGFDAFGHEVPDDRRHAGYVTMRSFGFTPEAAWTTIGRMARHVRDDEPDRAMRAGRDGGVDETGTYRLLAVLCTDEGTQA